MAIMIELCFCCSRKLYCTKLPQRRPILNWQYFASSINFACQWITGRQSQCFYTAGRGNSNMLTHLRGLICRTVGLMCIVKYCIALFGIVHYV